MIKYIVIVSVCAVASVSGFVRLNNVVKDIQPATNTLELTGNIEQLTSALTGYFGFEIEVIQNASTTKVLQLAEINQTEVAEVVQKSKEIDVLRLHSLTIMPAQELKRYNVKIVYAVQ
jgi:hypothetical protein